MSSPTELSLPQTFPYPIKILSLDVKPSGSLQRGTRLLSYSFVHVSASRDAQPETRFGTWDSALEGTLDHWNIKLGDVISQRKALDKPAVLIIEPCKHGVQIGGLCGLCGKDMTDSDYTGFSHASRASIQMTHSAFGPTVSLEEAQKLERENADHLLKSRKLSLIVDLDQTIVHATVDPTVGEWISEGEAWEARQAKKKASTSKDDSDDSDDSSSDSDDECNPNWEALKDVKKFRLGPESFAAPPRGKGKNKLLENEGCMYYIKPRPRWKEFLSEMATKYEMHVYTMGTRAYAEEVCSAIDPDGKLFGGRLLSRDESGSLTQKSLQRLFPCDTSMVVIIDDRADVWEWSPNLIKVIPYDFFVGIGDINSTFLPKVAPLAPTVPPITLASTSTVTPDPGAVTNILPPLEGVPPIPHPNSTSAETSETSPSPEESERETLATRALIRQNSLALEAQLEERPLAKKQEELQEAAEDPKAEDDHKNVEQESETSLKSKEVVDAHVASPKVEKVARKALLQNEDNELQRLGKLLEEVHARFYHAYDTRSRGTVEPKKRNKNVSNKREQAPLPFDVTAIIPRMRVETLEDIHILFSSVIPLDTTPETTEIWRMAHMFGATCSTELTSDITHVVAAKRGTVKVDAARKRGGIKIVWLPWLTDSIALWSHQDETPYLLDDPPVAGPSSSSPIQVPSQISSDPEPDADDWDDIPPRTDSTAGGEGGSFELDDINWNDINDEVDAAMNESDDENGDTRSEKNHMQSGNVSDEEEWTDETNSMISSVNSTPKLKRKRLRSLTPSESGLNGLQDRDILRSPLSKRKKLAADRTGYSKLKEAITADDLNPPAARDDVEGSTNGWVVPVGSPRGEPIREEMDEQDEEEEEEDDDDFLARELEEEWG